jgi:hypothetical protein
VNTIPCPQPGDHDAACICNGARELVVRPKTTLCPACGDPDVNRNLGCIAFRLGEHVGTACQECGTVGDVAEYLRRRAAAAEAEPAAVEPPKKSYPLRSDDDVIADLRHLGVATREGALEGLAHVVSERPSLLRQLMRSDEASRAAIIEQIEDLDAEERICKRILAELPDDAAFVPVAPAPGMTEARN